MKIKFQLYVHLKYLILKILYSKEIILFIAIYELELEFRKLMPVILALATLQSLPHVSDSFTIILKINTKIQTMKIITIGENTSINIINTNNAIPRNPAITAKIEKMDS